MEIEIVTARFTKLDKNWDTERFNPWSRMVPWSRLYLPLSGSGVVKTAEKEYSLTPGKMLLIPAFAAIHVSCQEHLEKYWSHFNIYFNNVQEDFFTFFHDPLEYTFKDGEMQYFSLLFRRLTEIYQVRKMPYSGLMGQAALSLLLEPFLTTVTGDLQRQEFPQIVKIITIMQRNKFSRLNMEELGKAVGLHPNYLSRTFKEKMGRSPMDYMKTIRMFRACSSLLNSDQPISEIAEASGYENVASFSKAFRASYGIGPRDYRREQRCNQQK